MAEKRSGDGECLLRYTTQKYTDNLGNMRVISWICIFANCHQNRTHIITYIHTCIYTLYAYKCAQCRITTTAKMVHALKYPFRGERQPAINTHPNGALPLNAQATSHFGLCWRSINIVQLLLLCAPMPPLWVWLPTGFSHCFFVYPSHSH